MEPVTVQKLTKLAEEAGSQIESPLRMLRSMYLAVLPRSWDADVDPAEFQKYFGELERTLHDAD